MTLQFAASTVPAFRVALLAALAARPGLQGVAVTDGAPPPNVLTQPAFVALLDVEGKTSVMPLNVTTQPRDERYVQKGIVSVVGNTRDDQVTLGDRAAAILAEIADQLRTTVRLEGFYTGPGNIYAVTLGAWGYKTRASDQSREAAYEFEIEVHARI